MREVEMPVIAIDGPSGSGKSSASRAVAAAFGWQYLDTGALYRALTLFALEEGIEPFGNLPALIPANHLSWRGDPVKPELRLGEREVSSEIREERVTTRVSAVAADPNVRAHLLGVQRGIINQAGRGIVVEGRDIGSTVWPDAELKIFLTADLSARAERRGAELASDASHAQVQGALAARDSLDSSRAVSPLRQVDDQQVIDATYLTLDEVVDEISRLVISLKLDQN
jgi:cytidylate kinase